MTWLSPALCFVPIVLTNCQLSSCLKFQCIVLFYSDVCLSTGFIAYTLLFFLSHKNKGIRITLDLILSVSWLGTAVFVHVFLICGISFYSRLLNKKNMLTWNIIFYMQCASVVLTISFYVLGSVLVVPTDLRIHNYH